MNTKELFLQFKNETGAEIPSEVGIWVLLKVIPGGDDFSVIWNLKDCNLYEVNPAAKGLSHPTEIITKISKGLLRYNLYVDNVSRSISQFKLTINDFQHYLEIVDELLVKGAVPTLQQHGNHWTKTKKINISDDKVFTEPSDEETESWKNGSEEVEPIKKNNDDKDFKDYTLAELLEIIDSDNENLIFTWAKQHPHPKSDELLAIYDKAKELKSNKLMNLVKQLAPLAESLSFKDFIIINEYAINNETKLPKVGDRLIHKADGIFDVVDFGSWNEMKVKYPEIVETTLSMLPDNIKPENLGRTWIIQDSDGILWPAGTNWIEDFIIIK